MAIKYGQLAIPDVATFKSANNIASTDSNGKLVLAQSPLTAGENITISAAGVISSTGGGKTYETISETINTNNQTADLALNPSSAQYGAVNSQSIRLMTAETAKGTISLLPAASYANQALTLTSENGGSKVDWVLSPADDDITKGNAYITAFQLHASVQESINDFKMGSYSGNNDVRPEVWSVRQSSIGTDLTSQSQLTLSSIDTYSSNEESISSVISLTTKHATSQTAAFDTTDIFSTSSNPTLPYRSLSDCRLEIDIPSINYHTNSSIDINNYNGRYLCYKGKGYGVQPNIMKVHGYYVARIFGRNVMGDTVPYGDETALPHAARLYLAYSLPVTADDLIDINKIWNSDTEDLPTDLVSSERLAQFALQDPDNTWFSFYNSYHYPYCFSINNTEGNAYIDVNVNADLIQLYDTGSTFPEPFKKPSEAPSYYAWRMACFPANPEFDVYKRGVDFKAIESTINSFALGFDHQATGFMSFTSGQGNKVLDSYSGAFGVNNTVAGYGSFTFGTLNTIVGESSNVSGNRNTVKGAALYAIGLRNQITGYPLVSTAGDSTLGGSVAIGMGNSITLSGETGRLNYGQSYCFGTKLSTTKPNQLILGWANEEVTGSSDTNHQIIFGVGNFNGTTVTRKNAMVMDATGIKFDLPVKGTLNLNNNLIVATTATVGTHINIRGDSNGCISVGTNNAIYKTCVAIGENNKAENTQNLSYRLLVGYGNTTDGQNTACLGKNLTTSGNHQTVVGVNNSAVSGYGLIVGTGDPNNKTKPCNGLQVSAEGIKVPVYSMGSDANAYPIGYDTGNVEYKLIRVCKDSNGAYSLEIV